MEDMPEHLYGMKTALGKHHLTIAQHAAAFDAKLIERVERLRRRVAVLSSRLRAGGLSPEQNARLLRRKKELERMARNRPFDAVVIDVQVPYNGVRLRDHLEALENAKAAERSQPFGPNQKAIWAFWVEEAKTHLGPHGAARIKSTHRRFKRMPIVVHSQLHGLSEGQRKAIRTWAATRPRIRIVPKRADTSYQELAEAVDELVETNFHRRRGGTSKRQP